MPKKINYQLNEKELKIIKTAMTRDKRPEVRQRATAIHLLHLGQKPEQVAETLAVKVGSIYNWHKRWRNGGLEGLANQPKSGRPSNATDVYCQLLEQVIEQDPTELGYPFTIWTAQRLLEHLYLETGIRLSQGRFRALLKARGYVYRRPKHDLAPLRDPDAWQQAKIVIEALKKKPVKPRSSYSLWTKRP
jgi:transposase